MAIATQVDTDHHPAGPWAGAGGLAERGSFLEERRTHLTMQRSAYRDQIDRLRERAAELLSGRDVVDVSVDDEFGEGDTLNAEREGMLALAGATQKRLEETERALSQIASGTYGICQGCRQPIPAARLEVLPDATHCVACKTPRLLRRR